MKGDAEWSGSASFASKSFDSVAMVVSSVQKALNTLTYLA